MRIISFDKIFSAGSYKAEDHKAYVVKKVGSDSGTGNILLINRVELLPLRKEFAPLYADHENLLGPIDLRDCFLVIPPGIEFQISADKMRLIGDLYLLEPDEVFPRVLLDRFEAQSDRRIEILEGSYKLTSGTTWKAGNEFTVYKVTNPVARRNVWNHLFLAYNPDPDLINDDDIGVTILHNDKPLDIALSNMGPFGLNLKSCALPPRLKELEKRETESLATDGTKKTFTVKYDDEWRKWIALTTDYTTDAVVIRTYDKGQVYAAKIPDPTTAGAAQPDAAIDSGYNVIVAYMRKYYDPAPDKLDLAEHPITQNPGDIMEIRFRNNKGADVTPTTDVTYRIVAFTVYERV